MDHGGSARRHQADYTDGPWTKWRTRSLAARAIRFMETYCRPPKGYGHGQPIRLSPSQKEWLEKILADGVTSAVKSCPRGQGKSTELAGLGVWATFDGLGDTGAPQVPVVATRTQQAVRSIYGVAVAMVKAEPELAARSIIYTAIGTHRIHVEQTGGEMFPMSNNVNGLQGLDPSLAIMDEIGFQPLEAWDAMLLASGKRERSLVVGTGTPGFDRDNALWALRLAWLEAGGDLPGFSYTEQAAPEGCDLHDEKAWRIANHALDAGYQNIEALRTAVKISPESHFRIFHLGQWVDGTDSWLGADGRKAWESLFDPYQLVPDARSWVGVDVGIKRDSTAVVIGQRRPDGRLHVAARIWLPTESEAIDLTSIMQHLRDLDEAFDIEAIAYDPRLFEVPAQMLVDEGLPMVEIPQSLERMTPAFGSLLEAVKRAEISHDGQVEFTTQILNAIPRYNERGFTLQKSKSRGKIDAAYALAMCHDRTIQRADSGVAGMVAWG
jgi:phage terminase large subunit-like protein